MLETKKINPNFSQILLVIVAIVAIIPAAVLAWLIFQHGVNIPIQDQWEFVPVFKKFSEGTLSFSDLIAQHNESRKFFPRLIFIALAFLTNWNIRVEMLVIFFLACLVAVNIYRLNRLTLKGSLLSGLAITAICNFLIFSPVQYENWLWGIQIVVFIPLVCLTTAILVAYSQLKTTAKFLICMALALVSTFSYANGMLAWVLILPVLTVLEFKSFSELWKHKWLYLLWFAGFISSLILYFYDYQRPEPNPSLTEAFKYPYQCLQYFLAFIGAPLGVGASTQPLTNSIILGAGIFSIFVGLCFYLLLHFKDRDLLNRSFGWLAIASYIIISALVTTAGRITFGVEQSLSSRYTTFSTYLIISILFLFLIVLDHLRSQGYLTQENILFKTSLWLLGILTAFYIQTYAHSLEGMSGWQQTNLRHKGCFLLINQEPDDCRTMLNSYFFDTWKERANFLDKIGFLNPGLIKTNKISDIAEVDAQEKIIGWFENLQKIDEDKYMAMGWAAFPQKGKPVDAVVLTYDNSFGESIIFAVADTIVFRPGVATHLQNPRYLTSGWQKTFSVTREFPKSLVNIKAWGLDTDTAKAYPLGNVIVIDNFNEK